MLTSSQTPFIQAVSQIVVLHIVVQEVPSGLPSQNIPPTKEMSKKFGDKTEKSSIKSWSIKI